MTTGRRAAFLYLLSAVPAGFSIFTYMKLVVRKDAAATAANVLGAEGWFRLATVAEIAGVLLFVASVLAFYELFRPVHAGRARLMAAFGLLGAGVQVLDSLADVAALFVLEGGRAGAAETALLLLRMHLSIYDLALAFFGVFCILMGALILQSRFLPRALGAFMAIDGLGYLTITTAIFLAPAVAVRLSPVLPYGTALLGEGSLLLWLLVKGASVPPETTQ